MVVIWRFEDLWQSHGDVSHASNFRPALRYSLHEIIVPPGLCRTRRESASPSWAPLGYARCPGKNLGAEAPQKFEVWQYCLSLSEMEPEMRNAMLSAG